MFCAQMVGKPRIAPDPAARPAAAPVPRSTLRRETLPIPAFILMPPYASSPLSARVGSRDRFRSPLALPRRNMNLFGADLQV